MTLDLPQPIAVVCHDAGAANLILAWLGQSPQDLLPVMEGPAARLWAQMFPDGPAPLPLEEALGSAASVLSGTGWQSDLEHRARVAARSKGLPSVAVIDHWVNYRDRFERDGALVLPDAIWICDADAEAIAARTFDVPLRRLPNLFIERQVAEIGPVPADGDVLYVAEPARDDWGRGVPGEFQALDYFLSGREALGIDGATPIRLRPHPSDPPGKWEERIAGHGDAPLLLDTAATLAEAMTPARWVVGCQSYAMVVALAAERSVASVLPPWAPPCALPQAGIIHLSRELAHQSHGRVNDSPGTPRST